MTNGYLSKDRPHLARLQRQRRASMVRIDYMPRKDALAVMDAKRATLRPGSAATTNSAVLDAIVAEWAELTGINKREVESTLSPARQPELSHPLRARAYEFGSELPAWMDSWLAVGHARAASQRVLCGARKHRDGHPCRAMSEPGKRRCKWHGGCSTGPTTDDGKLRALSNLRQFRVARGEPPSNSLLENQNGREDHY